MTRPIDRAATLFARQHGVAHVAQLRCRGVRDEQVRARVRSGSWVAAPTGLVAVRGAPRTDLHRTWSAFVACATRADGTMRPVAVGGFAALTLLDAGAAMPRDIEIVADRNVWCPRAAGVRVRKVSDWRDRAFRKREGLLVTALPDTLVDVAPYLTDDDYLTLLQAQCFGRPRLLARVLDRCHRGSKGSATARRVARALADGLDSPLHARGVRALRLAGLPPTLCDAVVVPGTGPSDCVYLVAGVPVLAVEFDGDVHRLSRTTFLYDRAKDLALREAGCATLRFTAEQVARPAELARHVRAALVAAELGMSPRGTGAA